MLYISSKWAWSFHFPKEGSCKGPLNSLSIENIRTILRQNKTKVSQRIKRVCGLYIGKAFNILHGSCLNGRQTTGRLHASSACSIELNSKAYVMDRLVLPTDSCSLFGVTLVRLPSLQHDSLSKFKA